MVETGGCWLLLVGAVQVLKSEVSEATALLGKIITVRGGREAEEERGEQRGRGEGSTATETGMEGGWGGEEV